MSELNIVSENDNSTVITEYKRDNTVSAFYQSEAALEKELIKTLSEQGYEYLTIHTEQDLINNLKKQLELLNKTTFSEKEWINIFNTIIASKNDGILEKTEKIQKDNTNISYTRDNGKEENLKLIDKQNIFNNRLQLINQYEANEGTYKNRYDVSILVNGLPLVHIELKRRGVALREAFNQINRYLRNSFCEGNGLFEYIQIFIISNGTNTKYYSNTTRKLHTDNVSKKVANTFEFTSYWADQNNKAILDLIDFAKTFLTKRTLLNVISKYCVFTVDKLLMVMRPYQIVATEKILNRIEIAHNYKMYGKVDAGGYIWHTTGSGKTLTSFKTARLATKLDYIDKVLFVVDRKDLDYQTMKEYNNFKEGCANSNTSTKVLEQQLSDPNEKIIITTIQKLTTFIKKNPEHNVYNQEIVMIFDECHRGQFGDMHELIVKKFKKYYIFGFTGTPIFAENAKVVSGLPLTTEQIFGTQLHSYTIVNAINDKNVLPFKYEYIKTIEIKDDVKDEKVRAINEKKALMDSQRVALVTNYIVDHYAMKTKTNESYVMKTLDNVEAVAKNRKTEEIKSKKNINGFNSIFAVDSIEMAKIYYSAFKEIPDLNLKVALIYSYGVNGDDEALDGIFDENNETTEGLSLPDREFLENAIKDYNNYFGTSYDTSSDKFQNYYKDLSLRMKNREVDILIVANMFLTGFDAKTLNTLWVDKNLKWHGLIQAFSRTNRILNSVKTFGNIVCFRDLEKNLNNALSLFGDENASGVVLLRPFEDYYYGFDENNKHHEGYVELVEKLKDNFIIGDQIIGEQNQKDFVKLFGNILKAINILNTFDKFKGKELLSVREIQDYTSTYQDLHDIMTRNKDADKADINDDIVFEMELVKQIEVNIDYILALVKKYHDSNSQDRELLISIEKAISSSPDLRNKKELIMQFIDNLDGMDVDIDINETFNEFITGKKKEELDKLIEEERLDKDKTYNFIRKSFEGGQVETLGNDISELLPPVSLFAKENNKKTIRERVTNKILDFFERFFGISGD